MASMKEWFIKANTTKNVGAVDRVVRVALPFVVAGLWFAGMIPTTAALIVGIHLAMMAPTGLTGACAVYYTMGVSTAKKADAPAA